MKKLIAVLGASLLSMSAIADATLYGQLHASVNSVDGDENKTSVSSNSSRIGVKGATPIKSGTKMIYQAEWGIDLGGADDENDDVLSNRNQVLGIAGKYGAGLIGRYDTPFKIIGRKTDLFWGSQLGANYKPLNSDTWDKRLNNIIVYQTPKYKGFQGLAAYVTDMGGDDDQTAISVNGIYNAGPLTIGGGYEKHDLSTGNEDAIRLMGSYQLGKSKIVGIFQDEDNATSSDATTLGVGASYKINPTSTVKGQIYNRSVDEGEDGSLMALGYDYKFGKQTDLYSTFAISDNLGLGGGIGEGVKADEEGDAKGVSIGIRHNF